MKILRRALPAALFLVILSTATTAGAATRYAAPLGSGTACSEAVPCAIVEAINSAPAYSEVILTPGTYGSQAAPITTSLTGGADINLHGQAGAPRPVIWSNTTWSMWPNNGPDPGPYVSDLELRKVGGAYGILMRDGGVTERVKSISSSGSACSPGGIFRDSVCIATGATDAIQTSVGSSGSTGPDLNIFNVTAIATGTGRAMNLNYNNYNVTLNIRNSIFRSPVDDITANAVNSAQTTLNIQNSNFGEIVPILASGGAVTVTPSTTNQTAEPLFVNPAGEDFRQAAGSPTIDAGSDHADNGTVDFDGIARVQGLRTDIGAYEFPVAVAPPPSPATAPTLSKPKQSKTKFKAAGKGSSFQAASASKKKSNKGIGTSISLTASGEGEVAWSVFKQKKVGKKKVWKKVKGDASTSVVAGSNKFWFSGRWNKKKLVPGTYQLRGTPTVKGSTIKGTKGDEPGTVKGPTSVVVK